MSAFFNNLPGNSPLISETDSDSTKPYTAASSNASIVLYDSLILIIGALIALLATGFCAVFVSAKYCWSVDSRKVLTKIILPICGAAIAVITAIFFEFFLKPVFYSGSTYYRAISFFASGFALAVANILTGYGVGVINQIPSGSSGQKHFFALFLFVVLSGQIGIYIVFGWLVLHLQ